jgi:hypothetical protein
LKELFLYFREESIITGKRGRGTNWALGLLNYFFSKEIDSKKILVIEKLS